jgi:YhcH/YjgK/YiaL family protein
MILDTLTNASSYERWLPSLSAGFAFLRSKANASLNAGRHEIDGDRVYAMVAKYDTRAFHEAEPEAHRKYIDIQYIISGRETILWTPLSETAAPTKEYDSERDIVFFARNARARPFELVAGHFCVLFPDDGHQPGCHADGASVDGRRAEPKAQPVHKVIVKVRVQ